MKVKKAGKIVFGADLTREEQEALNMEIQKSIKEYDRNNLESAFDFWFWREALDAILQ